MIYQMQIGKYQFPDSDKFSTTECEPILYKILTDCKEYIDWDKFLLITSFKAMKLLDNMELEGEEDSNLRNSLNYIILKSAELIQDKTVKISGITENFGDGKPIYKISYSYKQFEKDMEERLIDGQYYDQRKINNLKNKVLSGEIELSTITNPKVLQLLKLTNSDIEKCIEVNSANAEYFVDHNMMKKSTLMKYIRTHNVSDSLLEKITAGENPLVRAEEVYSLYLEGRISIEQLAKFKEELLSKFDEKTLIEKYRKLKEDDLSDAARLKIEKYFAAYREFKIRDASPEEKDEIGNEIILELR